MVSLVTRGRSLRPMNRSLFAVLAPALFLLVFFLTTLSALAAPFSIKVDFRPSTSPATAGYVADTGGA